MVDTISSLASIDYRHDEWGVDVTVGCSQKGLMLPPGLGFNAVSEKALKAAKSATTRKSYWSWADMAGPNAQGFFPYTPATSLLYGLSAAIDMLNEEGLDNVFARHQRHAEATRRAVAAWGLENLCSNPKHFSPVLTAVMMPQGHDADAFRKVVLENFDLSLGTGLSKVAGKVFRIGHLGDINDLTRGRHARGRRNGPRARRGAAQEGRRCRRARLPHRNGHAVKAPAQLNAA